MPISRRLNRSTSPPARSEASWQSDDEGSVVTSNHDAPSVRPVRSVLSAGRDRSAGPGESLAPRGSVSPSLPESSDRRNAFHRGRSPGRKQQWEIEKTLKERFENICQLKEIRSPDSTGSHPLGDISSVAANTYFPILKTLYLPDNIESIGPNCRAPRLEYMGFVCPESSRFTHVGKNFRAPLLKTLLFCRLPHFQYFDKGFDAPNVQLMRLDDSTNFRAFPEGVRFPHLTQLSVKNCKNFQQFPEGFFDGMKDLTSLDISGTGVNVSKVPKSIQENLRTLFIPENAVSIGQDLTARRLLNLKFSKPSESRFTCFENNFSAPLMTELFLLNLPNFRDFGTGFNAPALHTLKLTGSKNFEAFPEGVRFPALNILELGGCENFRSFPAGFFNGMTELHRLILEGTQVRFESLPDFIRKNAAIYIDIKPVDPFENVFQPLDWRQTTHAAPVHISVAESAIRLLADLPPFDVDSTLEGLRAYVFSLPDDPIPEGLNPDLPTPQLMNMFQDLSADHPYRDYYRSQVKAAQRALTLDEEDYLEPLSNVPAKTFLAAGWFASNLKEKRMPDVSREEARENIVRALYEAAREYNIDQEGHDDGRPVDDSACGAGKFNKYAEYLSINLRVVEIKSFPPEVTRFAMERFLKQEFRRRLSTEEITLKDFSPPDEEGQVFCSESYAKKIGVKKFLDKYCEQEETSEEYRVRDSGFMEYLLCHTDFSSLLIR